MKKKFKIIQWIIPLSILLLAIGFKLFISQDSSSVSDNAPIPVRVVKPLHGDVKKTLSLNAYVESETMVIILPLVSGIMQELFVDVGDHVEKDAIIARIDSESFSLQLKQAEAAYLSAKSSYERLAQLYKTGATTQQNYESAKGQYEAYASQRELARLQLNYANVKSPIDGVVLVKHLSPGSIAAPERPLVTVGDISELILRARVPESYYNTILSAKEMPIIISRLHTEYRGKIKSIAPFVSAETKNFEVIISIEDPKQELRPGMFVEVSFELERWKNAWSLPFTALTSGSKLWSVQDGKAQSMEFYPEKMTESVFLVGPEFADKDFIIEGNWFIYEDSPVKIIPPASASEDLSCAEQDTKKLLVQEKNASQITLAGG